MLAGFAHEIKYEELGYWYLRLNGFLTIPNFVVHPDVGNNQETDVDILGVRFPYRAENLERPMEDDPVLIGTVEKTLIVFAEVKAGKCSLNGPWTRPERRNMLRVLRAVGAFTERESPLVSKALQDDGAYTNQLYHVSLVCLGMRNSEEVVASHPQVPQILWDHVLEFIFNRFYLYKNQKVSHPQWDPAATELWRIFQASRHDVQRFSDQVKLQLID